MRGLIAFLLAASAVPAADFADARKLVAEARDEQAITTAFASATKDGEDGIKAGKAWLAERKDLLLAVRSASPVRVVIDDSAPVPMKQVGRSDLYVLAATVTEGTTHNAQYLADGRTFEPIQNIRSFDAWAYERQDVPKGKLSEKMVHESTIYPNSKTDWWIYVPAQYSPGTPAGLMVWQDGQGLVARDGSRVQIMIDNLTHEKKIPVIVHVFIAPAQPNLRSVQYDSMDDTYARFIRDEILPKVTKMYNVRSDAYSRAMTGASSGGICSLTVAWHMPDQFSRVLSRVGSFTSIQWRPGQKEGGNLYPFMIRKMPKRNIRVWLQDGYNDLENTHGSWPLQNLQMANSLKMRGYDFHLHWTSSFHNGGGGPDIPDGLIWLWRGYDPAKTSEEYQQDPAEKTKPEFRVRSLNRSE